MNGAAWYAIATVAGLHVVFALAEVFFWETLTPRLKVYDAARAHETAAVGRNMGVYNAIMASCLIWLLYSTGLQPEASRSLATLFLSAVIFAGVFGGVTIKWTIPLFQSLPALVALVLLWRPTLLSA